MESRDSTKKGLVFDIRKYSINDGPGIRTTIFFKSCYLHCEWCHNPEGQSFKPELIFSATRCIDCRECIKSCVQEALSRSGSETVINREK